MPATCFFADELHESFAAEIALGMVSHGGAEPGRDHQPPARASSDGDDASWFDGVVRDGRSSSPSGRRVARAARPRRERPRGVPARRRSTTGSRTVRSSAGRSTGGSSTPSLGNAPRSSAAIGLLDRPGREPFAVDARRRDGSRLVLPVPRLRRGRCSSSRTAMTPGCPSCSCSATAALRRGYHVAIFDGPGSRPHARGAGRTAARRLGVDRRLPCSTRCSNAPMSTPIASHCMGWSLGGSPRASRRERRPPVRRLRRRPRSLRHPRRDSTRATSVADDIRARTSRSPAIEPGRRFGATSARSATRSWPITTRSRELREPGLGRGEELVGHAHHLVVVDPARRADRRASPRSRRRASR